MPAFSTISLGSSDGGTFVFFNKTSRSKFVCFLFFSFFFSLALFFSLSNFYSSNISQ